MIATAVTNTNYIHIGVVTSTATAKNRCLPTDNLANQGWPHDHIPNFATCNRKESHTCLWAAPTMLKSGNGPSLICSGGATLGPTWAVARPGFSL